MEFNATIIVNLDVKVLTTDQVIQLIDDLTIELAKRKVEAEQHHGQQPPPQVPVYLPNIFVREIAGGHAFAHAMKSVCYDEYIKDHPDTVYSEKEYKEFRPTLHQLSRVKQSTFLRIRSMGVVKWKIIVNTLIEHGYVPIEDMEGAR